MIREERMQASHMASLAADAEVAAAGEDAQSGARPGGPIAAIDGAPTVTGIDAADVGVRPRR
jgi:hypothetical protein